MADGYISQITLPNNNTYLLKDSEKITAINASGIAPFILSSSKSGTTYTLTGSITGGTAGQVLKSQGSGAPTWEKEYSVEIIRMTT